MQFVAGGDVCLNRPGGAGAAALAKDGTFKYWQSMLRYPCGSLQLWNYPASMRDVPVTDNAGKVREDASPVDLAAIDIFRDRERGVPRFNDFRRKCASPLRWAPRACALANQLPDDVRVSGDLPFLLATAWGTC